MCLKLWVNSNAWCPVTEADAALTFTQLVERLGGFTPQNVESWVFVKSPFTLSHWTMNVIEVLLIVGALWGLRHSMAMLWRRPQSAPTMSSTSMTFMVQWDSVKGLLTKTQLSTFWGVKPPKRSTS